MSILISRGNVVYLCMVAIKGHMGESTLGGVDQSKHMTLERNKNKNDKMKKENHFFIEFVMTEYE